MDHRTDKTVACISKYASISGRSKDLQYLEGSHLDVL